MKLASLIDEKYGLPGNPGRDFGEKFIRDFISPNKFAELWTAIEATYPKLQPKLQATFEKTNELLTYIKPELGDEAYRVSKLGEAPAQELSDLLDDAIEATEQTNNLEDTPDEKTAEEVIQYFDNIFTDMLMIFTSNTASDKPLEPYKQTDMGFRSKIYKELALPSIFVVGTNEDREADIYFDLNKHREQIQLDHGPNTFRMLQQQLMLDKEAFVENWLIKNGYIKEIKPSFEEQIREVIKREIKSLKDSH